MIFLHGWQVQDGDWQWFLQDIQLQVQLKLKSDENEVERFQAEQLSKQFGRQPESAPPLPAPAPAAASSSYGTFGGGAPEHDDGSAPSAPVLRRKASTHYSADSEASLLKAEVEDVENERISPRHHCRHGVQRQQ